MNSFVKIACPLLESCRADVSEIAVATFAVGGELLELEWRRVDLRGKLICLEAEYTKAGKRRSIPINKDARAALVRRARFRATHCPASRWVFCHRDGRPIRDVKRSFNSACERVGIADYRVHDMRHTCAARLVSAGIPLVEVRDLLDHSTIKMTERHAHLAPENLRVAVSLLESKSHSGHTTDATSQEMGAKSLI